MKRKCKVVVMASFVIALAGGTAKAQFGGTIVFDPAMFARQLQQLTEETRTVANLAEQLKYIIKNTTGGGAGVWSSNGALLSNLGGIIAEANGLSYSLNSVGPMFQQTYPGYVPSAVTEQASAMMTLGTLNGALQSAEMQSQEFSADQAALGVLEVRNRTAIGNLQAIQVGNELALAQAQQLQLLRQLAMAQTNSENVAEAERVNNEAQDQLGSAGVFFAPPSGMIPEP